MEDDKNQHEQLIDGFQEFGNSVDRIRADPRRIGPLLVETANNSIARGLRMPDPRFFCHRLIVEFELIFCYAASNKGKSIFCNQLAAEIAQEEKVLYIDCELSTKQYQRRSTDAETGRTHLYSNNLHRAEIDKNHLGGKTLAEAILEGMEQAAQEGFKIQFIDNLTYICPVSEKGDVAVEFMHRLNALKEKYKLTLVVVAHCPKRDGTKPITGDDLYGSSRLMQLADSAFAIGQSAQDPSLRYVKTTKYRADEYPYPADHVAIYKLETKDGFTQFTFQEFGNEKDHLRPRNMLTEIEDMQEFVDLQAKGLSLKEIANETGCAKTTIHRKLKKAEKMGIVPSSSSTADSPDNPSHSTPETEQVEQDGTTSVIPFFDEENWS